MAVLMVDAVGCELPFVRGASRFVAAAGGRGEPPPILCEVAPGAYPLLGSKIADLFDFMAGYGYAALDVEHDARPVRAEGLEETTNVLFVAEGSR